MLEPLDAEAVAAIAALYAPAGQRDPGRGAAAGEPRRRRAAFTRRRANGRAARRPNASTRSPAAPRPGAARRARSSPSWPAASSTCSRRCERIEERPATGAPVVCPYKGLASFDRDDAEYFFGREGLVAELVAHLVGARLLARRRPVRERQVLGRCAPGCCPRSRAACCPAASTGRRP